MEELKKLTPIQAKAKLWSMGIIAPFKLDEGQIKAYNEFNVGFKGKHRRWFQNWSRRRGKTHTMLVDALEQGMTVKNGIFKFAAPTQRQVKEIIHPIIRDLLEDCPIEFRPVWKTKEEHYYFPSTGATLGVAGCDGGHAEKLRGTSLHRIYR